MMGSLRCKGKARAASNAVDLSEGSPPMVTGALDTSQNLPTPNLAQLVVKFACKKVKNVIIIWT
jgi:hypothetical protein